MRKYVKYLLIFLILLTAFTTIGAADNLKAYVVNGAGTYDVELLNLTSNTVEKTITGIGDYAVDSEVSPDKSKVYVLNQNSYNISIIDTTTNTVTDSIPLSQNSAYEFAMSPDGNTLYVAMSDDNFISVVDTTTKQVTGNVTIGGVDPYPQNLVISPDGTKLYTTDLANNTIAIIDTDTKVVTYSVAAPSGFSPYGMRISPDGTKLYVLDWYTQDASRIDVYDIEANQFTDQITGLGSSPQALAINTDGSKLYAGCEGNGYNHVYEIDPASKTITHTLQNGYPYRLAVSPDGSKLYVGNKYDQVDVVDTDTFTVSASIPDTDFYYIMSISLWEEPVSTPPTASFTATPRSIFPGYTVTFTDTSTGGATGWNWDFGDGSSSTQSNPTHLYWDVGTYNITLNVSNGAGSDAHTETDYINVTTVGIYDNPKLYVVNGAGADTFAIINTTSDTIEYESPDLYYSHIDPYAMAVSPDGSKFYTTNVNYDNLNVYAASNNSLMTTISSIGNAPSSVVVSPDGKYVYVASETSNDVTVVDAATNTIITSIATGDTNSQAIAVTPNGKYLYVANGGDVNNANGSVSVIDTTTRTLKTKIPGGICPEGVVVTPDGKKVYVANGGRNANGYAGTVSVIDTATNTVTKTIENAGAGAWGIVITPDGSKVYVADQSTNPGKVTVIDTATDTITKTISACNFPIGIAITPDGKKVYVDSFGSDNRIDVIDTSTDTVTKSITSAKFDDQWFMAIIPAPLPEQPPEEPDQPEEPEENVGNIVQPPFGGGLGDLIDPGNPFEILNNSTSPENQSQDHGTHPAVPWWLRYWDYFKHGVWHFCFQILILPLDHDANYSDYFSDSDQANGGTNGETNGENSFVDNLIDGYEDAFDRIADTVIGTINDFRDFIGRILEPITKPGKVITDILKDLLYRYFGIDFSDKDIALSNLSLKPATRDTYYFYMDLKPLIKSPETQYGEYKYTSNRQIKTYNMTGLDGATCNITGPSNGLKVRVPVNSTVKNISGQIGISDIFSDQAHATLNIKVMHVTFPWLLLLILLLIITGVIYKNRKR